MYDTCTEALVPEGVKGGWGWEIYRSLHDDVCMYVRGCVLIFAREL